MRPIIFYGPATPLRSRSAGEVVLTGRVDVPAPPTRLVAAWQREVTTQLQLEPGDVEPLSLARARMRWPGYRPSVQAVEDWTDQLGLEGALASSDVALMACRGARFHHDADTYGGHVFCNLFLSEDQGLDLFFPSIGQRIALARGVVVVFDTGQPHAVVPRGGERFHTSDFPPGRDCTQVFLTWELPVDIAPVARALQVNFDLDPSNASGLQEGQVRVNGARVDLCPASGQWRAYA